MKHISFLLLALAGSLFFQSCAHSYIDVGSQYTYPKTPMAIDAHNKMICVSAGIIFDLDIYLRYGGPKIVKVILLNARNDTLWMLTKKKDVSGSSVITYSNMNGDYDQIVPSENTSLPELTKGALYVLDIAFEHKRVVKQFTFVPALIYLDDDL